MGTSYIHVLLVALSTRTLFLMLMLMLAAMTSQHVNGHMDRDVLASAGESHGHEDEAPVYSAKPVHLRMSPMADYQSTKDEEHEDEKKVKCVKFNRPCDLAVNPCCTDLYCYSGVCCI